MKSPLVEKDAGAEILLWRVHVVDEFLGDNRSAQRVFYHYIRIKIFDEKGKEKAATVDLPYRAPGNILDVAGRTIKTDGSIVELDGKSVYKRELIRTNGLKESVVSFAMPAAEPGALLEYRWKQTEDDNRFRYLRVRFQREFPIEKVTWFVKPLQRDRSVEQLFLMPLNSKPSPIQLTNDGYDATSLENVPAAHTEPLAPSAQNNEPWALLFYHEGGPPKEPAKFWPDEGRKVWKETRDSVKSSDELKKAAAEAIASAKTDDEKTAALVMLVRRQVRNVLDPGITAAERTSYLAKLPHDRLRNSAEIFQSGIGTPNELTLVFLALAEQAGIEVRPVLLSDREEVRFNPKSMNDTYFLSTRAAAVRRGDSWKVLDVSDKLIDPLMLPWRREAVYALICDSKEPAFMMTPPAPPESSTEIRYASLKLSAEGTLEGDVIEKLTGHRAEAQRRIDDRQSPAQQEETARKRIVAMFPDADVSDFSIENAADPSKPLTLHYHLRAPLFAQGTAKRILFQPNAFRRSQAPRFTAADRRLPIEFPYAWKESDQIHILLPDGYDLDNADAPGSLSLGKPGSYEFKMTVTTSKDHPPDLFVQRDLSFGNGGTLFFPVESYGSLKKAFDEIQSRDAHTLSLKTK